MSRILIAECKQEVSSFNPAPSRYEDFRVVHGAEMVEHHRRVREEVGGALSVFGADPSVRIVPTFGASSNTSGGVLAAESFQRLAGDFLAAVAGAGPVDAAYFSLHGAMQAEGEDDPEGYLLAESRKILGERIPFIVSLDLHGILTDRMLEHSDAVVAFHTYPHVDFYETGSRAANVLMKIIKHGVRPVTARVKIPALVRGDELITETGAIGECIRLAQRIEAESTGLSAGVMWGNPFTDVPELRTNSFVVTDGDAAAAKEYALQLADIFWKHHEQMQAPLTGLADAVMQAKEIQEQSIHDKSRLRQAGTGILCDTVVLMDAADATSSGASGDSNAILRELMRQNYRGSALIPIVDPAAVRQAFAAGIGATISTTVGGTCDPKRFQPLPITARVRMLSDGKFCSESFGWHWNSGDTAVLVADNYTLIVGSRPVSLFDRSWFYAHGQDPRRFDLVIVKSPHCEHHMFAEWCAKLINVDAPGSTSANLKSLGHTRCRRPMFPLDVDVPFQPAADVFCRR